MEVIFRFIKPYILVIVTACKPVPKTCQDPVKTCPESGFLKDQNNCDSCLCNDPCKEVNM